MARAAPALSAPEASTLPSSGRSMLKDVGAATEMKHLCPSQRGSRDLSRRTSPGLNSSQPAGREPRLLRVAPGCG